ncbi:50S ribosomal protein L35 isoform 1 [Hibiscus syriacus]|uniref:50S ribosomal protein L35 isoform 1 n=1 Tax=Hibiscus syriacus TaxID=106335 RepID=A0A6A3B8J1_HIBSY|nr:50S ribosomal protein L35 isoform 1 [Hibiscus syriacus]
MVQLMRSGNPTPEPEACREKAPVKLEIVDDSLEEEHGPVNKRFKLSPNFQQWNSDANAFPIPPAQYNPLDEPSPLGLKLRKSPSLLDLIQMRLSQSQASGSAAEAENSNSGVKKESKAAAATDKLKASNFPASILRIGHWEYKSRYEGDLVAKCYFAKHKLVWEVLEGGLKSKIEIQWSDIMAIKANCPDNGPGTLNVLLARQPLFFRETNPQPRKHTLWQTTSDFTDGQASIHRQHFLQCPQGLLNKHFEKLIQCDMRLNCLSRQPEIILDSPYFESRNSVFEDPGEPKGHDYCQGETGKGSTSSGFQAIASSPAAAHSSSFEIEKGDSAAITSENMSREAPSPSSVIDSRGIEGSGVCEVVDSKGPRNWDQIKVPGLHPSMSMSELMNHIGHRLSEHMTSEIPSSENRPDCQEMLEDIAQYLLSDTQFTTASDEKSLMSRVNSLCCLLQKDGTTGSSSHTNGENYNGPDDGKDVELINKTNGFEFNTSAKDDAKAFEGETKEVSSGRNAPGMSRKDSFSELLLHLPRIASLPKFLFNISEDGERQAR